MAKTEREWEIEDAARTLTRAEQIKADPSLYPAVQAELARQAKAAEAAMGVKSPSYIVTVANR